MGSVTNTPRSVLAAVLAAGLFAAFSGEAAPAEKKAGASQYPVSNKHRSKNLKNYAEQDSILAKAREALKNEKFANAVEGYEEVKSILELEIKEVDSAISKARYKQVQEELFRAKRLWGASLMRIARLAAADKRYDDAIRIASEAGARDPYGKAEQEQFIDYCEGMKKNIQLEQDRSISQYSEELKARDERIKRYLANARSFYKARDYMAAITEVEKIYLLDPTNVDAIDLSGKAYRKLYYVADQRGRMNSAKAVAVSSWQWVEPVFSVTGTEKAPQSAKKKGENSGVERLEQIIFPSVELDEASLQDVISFIQDRSKRYAKDGLGGVVIESNLPAGANEVTVSMALKNVPLSTILRVLCLKAGAWSEVFRDGVKYTVGDEGRRITLTSGSAQGGMSEKIFSVPDVLYRMVSGEAEGGASATVDVASEAPAAPADGEGGGEEGSGEEGSEGGDGGAQAALSSVASSSASSGGQQTLSGDKWKECFRNWLVPFPEGSSVYHHAARGEIIVRNTPENLQLLEVIIGQIQSMTDPLVMIEVKAVEISESDYQELGFDWSIANVGIYNAQSGESTGANAILGATNKNSQWFLEQGVNTLLGGTLSPTRSLSTPIVKDWNIFSSLFGTQTPFGSDIPFTVNLTINALCQNNRTETVSAPKIITKATPGKGDDNRAIVNMGKSYYFPESWDELEVDIESTENITNVTITPPQPDFGDSTFVGMQFNVKPRLLSDNKTLEVQLKVNASSYAVLEGSEEMPEDKWNLHVTGTRDGKAFDWVYPIFMPRFYKRNLDIITHIIDGETIVVGGMVEAQTQAINDKIPFLGDLPLIGRLFQSQSETQKRTNMLIFLSARLMKNDGTPLNSSKPTGMPDFNR
ncbi:MAG: hypothetical protein J6S24_10195 [Lentisphaeria bacterium]|nr:hypothetical protein [Lentisphaeria bacterium]